MKQVILGLIFCSLIVATASALPKNVTTWTPSHAVWPNWYTNGSPVPQYSCVTNFYVSSGNISGPVGNNANTGTLASPYATIAAAWSAHAGPGVCINVIGPNNNNVAGNLTLTTGGNSNSPTGWAVLRAVDVNGFYNPVRDQAQNFHVGVAPRIYAASNVFTEIELNTAYIIVDGFEVDFSGATNPGGGGGGCGFVTNGTSGAAHHLVVENNLVHDAGFTGIQLNNSEYIWIYNNGVHDNASVNGAEGSGISVWEPHTATAFTATGLDTALPFHIFTINNIIWHNFEGPVIAAAQHTDGDAIIMDTFTAANGNPVNYTFPALVYGNVACYNGGGAAQMTSAQFVTVAHNSSYANYIDLENSGTWRGEGNIWNADSTGNKYFNNSFYTATSGAGINAGSGLLSNNIALNFHPNGQAGNTVGANIVWPNAPFNESTSQFSGTGNGFPIGQLLRNPNYKAIGALPNSSTNTPPCDLHPSAAQTIGAQTVTSAWWHPTIGAYQYSSPRAVAVAPVGDVPANLLAGSIGGTPQVGLTLTAIPGTWTNAPTSFVYTWMRGTVVDQTGASATYVPVQADTGSPINVSVTATNSLGTTASAAVTPVTAVVAAAPFAAVVNPVIVDGTTFAKTSTGIQSAINACTGSCNGVSLAAGTFTITGVIAPKSNVAIFGQGKGVTILQGGVPFGATFLYNSATNLTNIRLSDMTIDTQFVSKSSGIQISNMSNSTISKMAFTNGDVDGWQLYIGANGDMTTNGVQNFNNLIDRIDFTNHAGTLESFLIFNSQFATISNITLTNATGPGIGLWQKDYDSQLTAITCTNSAETNGLIYYSVTVERTVIANLHTTNCGPAIKGANISDWGTFGLTHADTLMVSDAVIVGGANSTNYVGVQIGGVNNMTLKNAQISGYQVGVQLFNGNGNNVVGSSGSLDQPTNWQILGGIIKDNNGTNNFNDLHPGVLFSGTGGVENGLMQNVQLFDDQVTHTQTNPISFQGNASFSNISFKANSLAAGAGISSIVFGGGATLGGVSPVICNTNYTGAAPAQGACTAPVNTAPSTISGTPQVGQALTATTGTWTNSPTSYVYTWTRTTGNVTDKVSPSVSYSPVAADVGSTITVSVVATNASGPSASVVSAATSAIAP